ncbi:Glutamate 5-kinase [gamma proteobacterium HdN1]|nr:Glutamate 5-kinase [gamma proteobacterium HdN1]
MTKKSVVQRSDLGACRRWVVKIGSALLTDNGRGLDRAAINGWVEQIAWLRAQGVEVVLVSSGAVAEGMCRLGWKTRPHAVHELQAAAAVGQMGLVQTWESLFQQHQLQTAQILVTHDDLSNRKRYLNSRSTLLTLLSFGIIPVVNENDTVVTDEIRFGDNDTLGALVANLVEADLLVILTDQLGMFDKDPREYADARLLEMGHAGDPALMEMASGKSGSLGRGGMATKVRAARLAARSGAPTLIVGGKQPDVIRRAFQGDSLGTLLLADLAPLTARKQWLAGHLQMRGTVQLDEGAVRALREKGVSLLPVGVSGVTGDYSRGEMVLCVGPDGERVARGLTNYSAEETRKILRASTDSITARLGYVYEPELMHRDNMVIFPG